MSSSSEEDIPLAQLMKKTPAKKRKAPAKKRKATTKKRKTPAKKTKTPAKRKTPAKKRKKVSESEEDDDSEYSESSEDSSDSEDEVLANMKKKNSKPKASATKKKRARSKSRSAPKKRAKKIKANKAQKSSTENEYKTSIDDFKNGPAGSRKINYTQDIKLQLSLAVLCRWWYVMEWPSKTGPHPGPNYAEMAGMPGVYIGVSNEVIGQTIDTRDHNSPNKPSIANMMTKSCSELKGLWVKALGLQLAEMEALGDDYRCGNKTKPQFVALLQKELKYAKDLPADKLEKSALKQEAKKKKKKGRKK